MREFFMLLFYEGKHRCRYVTLDELLDGDLD